MDNSNIVPLYGISASGAAMLKSMTEHDDLYKQFLKLQGRLYKFPATVALEFYSQKPDTDCIGTESQWNRQGYQLKTGADAVHFIDSSGNIIDYYDFSQVDNNAHQPARWMITAENADSIKQILTETNTIPDSNTSIIAMSLYCTDIYADVTDCMNKLHISQEERKAFFSAYVNAFSLIVAGRLEINAQPFNITPDMSFFKSFGSDIEKMTFLSYAGRTARSALRVIENAVTTYEEKRRNIDELRNIYEPDGERTEERTGGRAANDPERAAEKLSDIIENGEAKRNPRLGDRTGVSGEQETGMVSDVQGETRSSSDDNLSIPVQSVQRDIHDASRSESGEVNDGRADRNVRTGMDGLHGEELSDGNGISANEAQVPDSGKTGTEIGRGLQGSSGGTVRQGESSSSSEYSTGLQRNSEMGRDEAVLRERRSDEGESADLSDGNRLNDKLNSVFSDEPSTAKADGFVMPDNELLIEITGSISEKSAEIIRYTTNGEYDKAVSASSELAELTRQANEIKERISRNGITNSDVAALQDITPKRKSVKNMLDADIAKAPKFENKLNAELGDKSPFRRLPSSESAAVDTRIPVIEIADRNSTLDSVREDIKNRTIFRGDITTKDTGWNIQISRNGLDDSAYYADSFKDKATLNMLYSLSDIVENSVLLDSEIADSRSEKKAFMHSLYGIYRFNDELYLTKMAAEEFLNGDQGMAFRMNNIQSIKIEPSRLLEFAENQVAPSVLDGSDISIADLTALVKAYDKKFFENPTAVGRTEREAEIFKAAELTDAQTTLDQSEEVHTETKKQIAAYAETHELTENNAESELRDKVATSINFPASEMTDEAFAERITAAIADVAHEYDLSAEQQNILHRFGRFATKYRLTENIFDSAFGKAPVFRTNYKDKAYLSEHFFDAKFNDIENSFYSAIQLQMTPASAENLVIDFPEYNFTIDLTKSEKFVMENVYDDYVGGIDYNGHERKDNFREIHESLTVGIDEYERLYTEKYDEANDYSPYEVYTYDNSRMDDLRFNITEFIDNASNGFTAYSVVNGEMSFEPVLRKEKVNMDYSELAVNAVNDFCMNENGREADLSNMKKIDIVSDVITDRNIPVSVSVDLEDPAIMYYVDDRLFRRDNFDSIELFYNGVLSTLESGRQNLFDIGVPESDFVEFYDKNAAHGDWQFYIIPDLKSLSANNGSVTPIERYDSLDKAIARFNELRPMEYNNDTEIVRGFPSAHLTMGLSNDSAELDILQVRGNQNYLVTDYTRYPKYADNENILAIVNDINEYIGFDRVMDFPKQNNGDPNEVIDVAYSEWQQPVAETIPDEQPLDKAKRLINQYSQAEFDNDVDFDDLHNVGLAYTTLTDEELSIQVTADLVELRITYEFDSEVFKVDEFDSFEQMNEALADLDFNDLIDVPYDVIDRHTEFKYEIYQLKMGEENHYLRFESYDDLRKHGYEVDFNNYEKVYEGDLTEDTTLESLYTKFNLDHPLDFRGHSLAVSDIIVLHRHGDFSANYVDDVGYKLVPEFFRAMHEPKVDTNINSEVTEETTGETKPAQPRYSQNAYVDGINTYELLIDEVRRGTGFENGKQRVLDFYNNNQPTAKELAAFLKKEYGIGGHSGSGNVLMVGSDSKGITFDLRSGAKYTHSWLNVAYAVETQILEKSYDKSQHMPNEITIGDRYRLHSLFGDYEVTVTGLQGIYPDEVVVTDVQNLDRMGYSVTYNMARTSLYNDGIYLGNTENAPEKVDTNINSPVKSDTPVIKNFSQLKKQLEIGMEFEITSHLRPECVGERRVVTSKNTVEFSSQKIDENGQPSGKDIHMEWGKAADWTFDNGEFTAYLSNEFTNEKELIMSFHIAESRENVAENENTATEPIHIERTGDYLHLDMNQRPFAITEAEAPKQEVKAVKLEFTGNADALNKLRDAALSLGATVIVDNANSVISIDTYENHVDELTNEAVTLGLSVYEKAEEKVDTSINSKQPERKRKNIQNRLYDKFCEMFPDIANGSHIHERYGNRYEEGGGNDDYEPLSVERLDTDIYGFMIWYIQNSDLMRDPDFSFELDHEEKTLTILDYQQDGVPPYGTYYQSVFDENGNADYKLLSALSSNFMQVLDITAQQNRPLTEYTTMQGDTIEVTVNDNAETEETPLLEAAVANDKSAEWRDVLNEYSRKHGLGELNIYPPFAEYGSQQWQVREKMKDGYEIDILSLVQNYGSAPYDNDSLREALENYDSRYDLNDRLESIGNRSDIVKEHGLSDLPDTRTLPDIIYADKPSEKINQNIAAIREVKRIMERKENGQPLYRLDDPDDPNYIASQSARVSKEYSDTALRRYSGWGGLPQVFDERYTAYSRQREALKELLTPEEYAEARSTTLNAHYTPQEIIDAMYDAISAMDLPRNARILEPSCGTGNFISRLPNRFRDCKVTGIEIDPITSQIAESLNSDNENVKIFNCGFEHADLDNDSFDLAIGNVPFGDYKMIDPDFTKDYNIHDAFFRRALNKVAPGGIVAFITSSGTLDKKNPQVREHLATYGDLVGAIRLPDNAFASAGTKVTTDIIFLQKREIPLQPFDRKPDWCYTAPDKNGLMINSYFVQNPNMVLGNMEKTTHFDMLTCRPIEGADLKEQLSEAIKNINAKVSINRREKLLKTMRNELEPWGKNFTYQVKDDKVYYRRNGTMDEIGLSAKDKKMVIALCDIRDVARKLIDLQKTEVTDEELVPLRNELNEKYDKFVAEFDNLTSNTVKRKFSDDSDYQLLYSLEDVNETEYTDKNGETQTKKTVEKAAIFSERTVNAEIIITEVDNAEEALEVSLDRKGRPDIQYMASLLINKYPDNNLAEISDTICNELIEKGYLFDDPSKAVADKPFSGICEKAEYLSGNVRTKLAFAKDAAEREPEKYTRNVEALKEVIPADIHAEEISVRMGCTWIDPEDYTEFLHHLSGRSDYDRSSHEVHYFPATGAYEISGSGTKFGHNVKETSAYGYNATVNMYKIAESVLNQKKVSVYMTVDDKRVIDPKATRVANEKARQIKDEFKKWIFADDKRKAKYERRYNDIFNSIVGRNYDGSKLTFPAMNKEFNLRDHQRNCVARAIYGGNTLAAHVVGAGKSAVMFTTVMKKKQLGLINKACVVVPKPLVEQTAAEWMKVYPDAKLLTVTNKDLYDEKNRELFMSRVATGSYDGIIMSQEQFEKIPMTRAFVEEHIGKQIDQLEDAKNRELVQSMGVKTPSVKEMERAIKKYKTELERLLTPKSKNKAKDSILNFEQLGFDYLVVDEAHAYKNGKIMTKMTNIAGVNTKSSGRSADMFLKSDYFNETFGDGHLLFCTGTPVSNSMTELYVMTRFLRPDLLKAADVELFDNWAATFGNVVTGYKQGADGQLKLKTSFSQFANLPELMAMYKEFADIQSAEKLDLPRPKLKGDKPQIVVVDASPEQKQYVKDLAERAERIANGAVDPRVDNLLKITSEARMIGFGNRAVKSLYEKNNFKIPVGFMEDEKGKVDKCIEKVLDIYNQKKAEGDTKAVQIIFSDIAVNSANGNFSAYEYIRDQLIQSGQIPENEIIFAPKSDAKDRQDVFKKINEGKYRVVIASTGTLGTGANIQNNLYALHHLDIPWKSSDFEQREGRILRQGNSYPEVEIFNYITKGTLDSYLYQTVTDKARFIAQLMDNKCPSRVCEDCDEKVLTYGEIQAAAEDNPAFRERIEKGNKLSELKLLQSSFFSNKSDLRREIDDKQFQIKNSNNFLENVKKDKAILPGEIKIQTRGGRTLTDTKDMREFIADIVKHDTIPLHAKDKPDFKVGDFEVKFGRSFAEHTFMFEVKCNATMRFEAGTNENSDNYIRLKNFFEHSYDAKIEGTEKLIEKYEKDIEQSKEEILKPFEHQAEIETLEKEIEELEEQLVSIKEQKDEVIDPDEVPITETAAERAEREAKYGADDDDYTPDDDNNIGSR